MYSLRSFMTPSPCSQRSIDGVLFSRSGLALVRPRVTSTWPALLRAPRRIARAEAPHCQERYRHRDQCPMRQGRDTELSYYWLRDRIEPVWNAETEFRASICNDLAERIDAVCA